MLLECKNVGKRFGKFVALKRVSLSFPSVGLVSIMGRSGSGKSTLLNILSGMARPSKGKVYYKGNDISSFSKEQWRAYRSKETSFLFQHYNLLPEINVLDNVALPLRISGVSSFKAKRKAKALLNEFGLGKMAPRNVRTLSGGEKQRVALCRALSTSPRILFADEPTGALDETNAKKVMEALKEASRKRLVVMVSHNEELVKEYSDRIIELGVTGDETKKPSPKAISKKGHSGFSWVYRFLPSNIRKNAFKNLMSFASGLVGFSALFLSVGFFLGNQKAAEVSSRRTLGYQSGTICKKDYVEMDNSPLKLVKQSRPSLEESASLLESVPSAVAEDDYSYFFPSSQVYEFEGEKRNPCSFLPVYDLTLSEGGKALLKEGEAPRTNDFLTCLVNEEFASVYGKVIGKWIYSEYLATVGEAGEKEQVLVSAKLEIVGVVEEFPFLNSPKVYYSHQGLKEYLRGLSVKEKDIVSFLAEQPPDSHYSSYRRRVFVHDEKDVPSFWKLIEKNAEEGYEIQSEGKATADSFLALSSALSTSLTLFLSIAVAGIVLTIGLSSFSSFVSSKKEVALLRFFGAKESHVAFLFSLEGTLGCLLACLLSLLACPWLERLVNGYFQSEFGVTNLLSFPYSNPVWVPLLCLGAAGLLGFLSSFIPLKVAGKVSIAEELRDE